MGTILAIAGAIYLTDLLFKFVDLIESDRSLNPITAVKNFFKNF